MEMEQYLPPRKPPLSSKKREPHAKVKQNTPARARIYTTEYNYEILRTKGLNEVLMR